ncbi:MAG: caspase family protein [Deltaproteobacteria bacterium]|nr:caspase family protein [Deltaproteobacteria bacterium]
MSARALHRTLGFIAAVTASILPGLVAAGSTGARRLALLVSSNDGGPGTERLRYAHVDAKKLRAVITELGGFRPGDVEVLRDPNEATLAEALGRLSERVAEAKADAASTTALVYYSGHAKDGELFLGAERYSMRRLRAAIERSGADVRLGVIDACESGAITRSKGGRPGPSFLLSIDQPETAKGVVLMTSSSEGEESQESDEVGGSYFTHYLASGLRGDADESGDSRVTLAELYQYTYHKTVLETAGSRAGVQHPTYSFDLSGSAQLILSDLSLGLSGVVFPEGAEGHYLVLDDKREMVAIELEKVAGSARRVALSPGSYVVKKRLGSELRVGRFELSEGAEVRVEDAIMTRKELLEEHRKGLSVLAELGDPNRVRTMISVFTTLQLFASAAARRSLVPPAVLFGTVLSREPVLGARFDLELSLGGNSTARVVLDEVALDAQFFEAQLGASLSFGPTEGTVTWGLGPRLLVMYASRKFPNDPDLAGLVQDYVTLSPGVVGRARYSFDERGDFGAEARLGAGLFLYSVDENRALLFGELGLGLGYRW